MSLDVKINSLEICSEKCKKGEYRSYSQTYCTQCDLNYVTTEEGMSECTECDPGSVSNMEQSECGK